MNMQKIFKWYSEIINLQCIDDNNIAANCNIVGSEFILTRNRVISTNIKRLITKVLRVKFITKSPKRQNQKLKHILNIKILTKHFAH